MLTTLATVKEELPQIVAGDTSKDAYLTRLISQASASIANYCDRNFTRARASEVIAVPLNMAAAQRLLLPRFPLVTVYSITMEASLSLIDPTSYEIDNAEGGIVYRSRGWSPWSVEQFPTGSSTLAAPLREARYIVDYDAGYDDAAGSAGTPAMPVPGDLERAAIELVKGWYYSRSRDPFMKSIDIVGVGKTEYWVGSLPGQSALPELVTGLIDNFRRQTVG